ncbi:MAG: RRXRR domain-containing protein [Coleofasciculus sp. B1-GNL1-01]|uniref:RRXRR domain-containing protein n=1 Tax=Coleofasciculus sp. B1-GNL1-01 TaxID=3068484 RepID=UPI0033033E5B
MIRVPVLSPKGKPLMPAKASRVRRWLKAGKAKVVHNDLGIFQVQLVEEPSGKKTQDILTGIDPGKLFTGVAVQSKGETLFLAHLNLPFKTVTKRMSQRAMMRRGRRGRRINRKLPFNQRNHRQRRFDNRKGHKIPPSIRANKHLPLRVIQELNKIYPFTDVVVEVIKARGDKGFSPAMVGQHWQIEQLASAGYTVHTQEGWYTSNLRKYLGLPKSKNKAEESPAAHAVDGICLAASQFMRYRQIKGRSGTFLGSVAVTPCPFAVISRPPICRRQLHRMIPSKGGLRRNYGGTISRHGFRKGDYVKAVKAGITYYGYVSGNTKTEVSVSNANWKRIGRFTTSKVQLLQRNTGLISTVGLSNLTTLSEVEVSGAV